MLPLNAALVSRPTYAMCRPENRYAIGVQKSAEQVPARKPTLPLKCRPENRHAVGGQKSAEQVAARKPTLPLKCRQENRHAIGGQKSAEQLPARQPTHLRRPEICHLSVGPKTDTLSAARNLPIKRRPKKSTQHRRLTALPLHQYCPAHSTFVPLLNLTEAEQRNKRSEIKRKRGTQTFIARAK